MERKIWSVHDFCKNLHLGCLTKGSEDGFELASKVKDVSFLSQLNIKGNR